MFLSPQVVQVRFVLPLCHIICISKHIISSIHQFTYAGLLFSAYLFQRFSFLFDLLQCFQTLNNVMVEIIDQHVPLIFSLLHIHCNHLCFVSIHSLCLGRHDLNDSFLLLHKFQTQGSILIAEHHCIFRSFHCGIGYNFRLTGLCIKMIVYAFFHACQRQRWFVPINSSRRKLWWFRLWWFADWFVLGKILLDVLLLFCGTFQW